MASWVLKGNESKRGPQVNHHTVPAKARGSDIIASERDDAADGERDLAF